MTTPKRPNLDKGGFRRRSLGEGGLGFTLIELLVATALVVVVSSAVAALAVPMRRAFDRGLNTGESVSRARTALHVIVAEVRNAGSGVVIGPTAVSLDDVIEAVTVVSPSTIAIARPSGPQGLLRHDVSAGATAVRLDSSEACSQQDATCGIRGGDEIAIFDAAQGETVRVSSVTAEPATLHLSSPLAHPYAARAAVATLGRRTFALRDRRLVRLTAGGAEQPIADHVAAFSAALSAGRVDLRVTLEPASAGGAPLEVRTSVALRR